MSEKMQKKTKIAIGIVAGGIFLAIAIVLIVICQTKALRAGAISNSNEHMSVMSDIEGIVDANPRVVDLGMLGAHDASTYNLSKYIGISGEVKRGMVVLYKCAWGLAYRYTKTQVSTIYDQLAQGARYVHIKCSYFGGKWCGSHSLIDGELDIYIKDVIKFLRESRGEIVVLHLLIMSGGDANVTEFLSEIFNIKYDGTSLEDLVPYEDIPLGELRYNDVTKNGDKGGAVVLLEKGGEMYDDGNFFDVTGCNYLGKSYGDPLKNSSSTTRDLTSPWYNFMNADSMAEAINRQSEFMHSDMTQYQNGFRVMQMQTAPTAKDLCETVGAWSLINKAKTYNPKIISDARFDSWMEVMPVILCDFVTSANKNFNRNINEKISAYNKKLVADLIRENERTGRS